jgi:hypothetical protein
MTPQGKSIFDIACTAVMVRAAQIQEKKPEGICPDCGSNTLQHETGFFMGEDWTSPHSYKNLQDLDEPGWYQCEEGHVFKVYYDLSNDEFYMK